MKMLRDKKDEFLDVYKAVFVHDSEFLELDDLCVLSRCCQRHLGNTGEQGIHQKSKLVSMVSSGKAF